VDRLRFGVYITVGDNATVAAQATLATADVMEDEICSDETSDGIVCGTPYMLLEETVTTTGPDCTDAVQNEFEDAVRSSLCVSTTCDVVSSCVAARLRKLRDLAEGVPRHKRRLTVVYSAIVTNRVQLENIAEVLGDTDGRQEALSSALSNSTTDYAAPTITDDVSVMLVVGLEEGYDAFLANVNNTNTAIEIALAATVDAEFKPIVSETVTVCAQDAYVSSNTCVSCPAGTSNDEGDAYPGSDTACDGLEEGVDDSSSTSSGSSDSWHLIVWPIVTLLLICCIGSIIGYKYAYQDDHDTVYQPDTFMEPDLSDTETIFGLGMDMGYDEEPCPDDMHSL